MRQSGLLPKAPAPAHANQPTHANQGGSLMNRIAFSIVGASLLAVAGVATAGPAGATADDTVNSLKSEGYNVQINGTPSANLSACTVTGVKKDAGGANPTAYVDISCPTGC
ncbi:hypothetical protein AOT93_24060 [Mycobacteroides sp. H110]|nr:hypothetical protein AOT87_08260 [Mycobacteroides sp. H003]KRQ35645.1 hypothetical protein AOT91_03650 [Mycobacteroides sp. H092]KRQ75695.1 hypothetical protein AOT93_24060 [Mycobacteroides sp. H110]RIU08275.1 hypothetical protein D2F01_19185 [Mycobacteroides abscessus]